MTGGHCFGSYKFPATFYCPPSPLSHWILRSSPILIGCAEHCHYARRSPAPFSTYPLISLHWFPLFESHLPLPLIHFHCRCSWRYLCHSSVFLSISISHFLYLILFRLKYIAFLLVCSLFFPHLLLFLLIFLLHLLLYFLPGYPSSTSISALFPSITPGSKKFW